MFGECKTGPLKTEGEGARVYPISARITYKGVLPSHMQKEQIHAFRHESTVMWAGGSAM